MKLDIRRSDRAFFVGTTGSGKTTLARELLRRQKDVVIIDPKHGFTWEGGATPREAAVTYDAKEVVQWVGPAPLIYRPTMRMARTGMDWLWDWVWERKYTLVYVDEVMHVNPSRVHLSDGMARCIQQGRQHEISVWTATQRPANIPLPILTETEHFFAFRLKARNDLTRMGEYMDPMVRYEPVSGHDFWYKSDRTQVLVRTNLRNMKFGG